MCVPKRILLLFRNKQEAAATVNGERYRANTNSACIVILSAHTAGTRVIGNHLSMPKTVRNNTIVVKAGLS